jgi:hypothetical protein
LRDPRPGIGWSKRRVAIRAAYAAYMASPAWYRSRERWLEAWRASHPGHDPVCLVCGQPWKLWRGDLHHRTYTRLGHENFDDLAPLCCRDHLCLHAILEGIPAWRRLPRGQATAMIIALLHDRARGREKSND